MRLVAIADTHLFTDDLTVPPGDVLIHAGDLCRAGSLEELAEAALWLSRLPHAHKVVVAGNHDWAFMRSPTEARALMAEAGVVYLEDALAVVAGLRIWGAPWQPAYNGWAFNLQRGAPLAEKWALIPDGLDVLVTHGPPAGIGDASVMGARRAGCAHLRARVAEVRPRLHLFGHIHQAGGAWSVDDTTFVNCTTWECERAATLIDLDGDRIAVDAPPAGG
ncbi:MAG: metallophosphatase domain-containing protein [Myxococcota bacterium]